MARRFGAIAELADIGLAIIGAVLCRFAKDMRNGLEPRAVMDAICMLRSA